MVAPEKLRGANQSRQGQIWKPWHLFLVDHLNHRVEFANSPALQSLALYSWSTGLGAAVAGCVSSGVHQSFAKIAGPGTAAVAYIFYVVLFYFIGISVSVSLLGSSFQLFLPGLVGGLLLLLSWVFAVNAVWIIGLAWADMTVASAAAVASFLWSKVVLSEVETRSLYLTILGLVLLVVGLLGLTGSIWPHLQQYAPIEGSAQTSLPSTGIGKTFGFALAIAGGVCSGLAFPCNRIDSSAALGIAFVWSQALGMLAVMTLIFVLALLYDNTLPVSKDDEAERQAIVKGHLEPFRLIPLATMQGFLMAIAQACALVTEKSPLGSGVAHATHEGGHFIAVLLGAFVFSEFGTMERSFIFRLMLFTGLDVAGIFLLLRYGT